MERLQYMVWSDSLECMVYKQFYYKFKKGKHLFIWNDEDCVYYDETAGDETQWDLATDDVDSLIDQGKIVFK